MSTIIVRKNATHKVSVGSIIKETAIRTKHMTIDIILNSTKDYSNINLVSLQKVESHRDKITKQRARLI